MNKSISFDDVQNYIDFLYMQAIKRPQMYFPSPEAFEVCVSVLEDIYYGNIYYGQFHLRTSNYTKYLLQKGYGSSNFTLSESCIDLDINIRFVLFSGFLRSYLVSAGRWPATRLGEGTGGTESHSTPSELGH